MTKKTRRKIDGALKAKIEMVPLRGSISHMREVKRLNFWVPPNALQTSFSVRIAEIDKLKAAHRAHLERLDAHFASLQHRAFRGELTGQPARTFLTELA